MDSYQAVYDAVRSRFSGCDMAEIVRERIPSLDTFSIEQSFRSAASDIAAELTRPSIMLRLVPYPDGNQWCVLYGENLQEGVAAFGDSPEQAMRAFDRVWYEKTKSKTPPGAV